MRSLDVDWAAGFRAAFANVSEYLVSPDDQAIIKTAYNVAGDDWPVLDEAILRCAWKRWRGQQNLITLDEIVGELRADQRMPADLLEQLTRCLTVEGTD